MPLPMPRTTLSLLPMSLALSMVLSAAVWANAPVPLLEPETPAADAPPPPTLEVVVVTGIQPGPGLWQVRRGDHTLWIMATLNPLPRRMDWEPRELDALVARADRVLSPPRGSVDSDLGFFGRLGLLPAALRARNNPDGQTLAQVLDPALYQRWEVQKAKYLGGDQGVERRRPLLAAFELMDEALEDLDLKRKNIVWERVERNARRQGRPIVPVRVEAKLDDPRAALREFSEGGLDDSACLEATIARLETDTVAMVERANAWAIGDVATLLERRFDDDIRACVNAVLATDAARKHGLDDLPRRLVDEWVRVAAAALAEATTSLAVADLRLLVADDGLLAGLRAKGYEVIAPELQPHFE